MFYFHGRKDKDFCLVSDFGIRFNAHFIGKKSKKGRDFTGVQSTGVLFGPLQFYVGARKVSDDNMPIQLNGDDFKILQDVVVVGGWTEEMQKSMPWCLLLQMSQRLRGYDVTKDDCFVHLELSFKLSSLTASVNGVLGWGRLMRCVIVAE